MKLRTLLAALAATAAVAAPASPAAAQRQAAQRDWSQTVVQTPEGGYRMGNPRAQTQVVEYLSLTCPHCRDFAATGMPQLMPHIRSGRVSIEYRNFVLNPMDVAAAMISRCATPANYFRFSNAIMADQANWVPRAQAAATSETTDRASAVRQLGQMVTAAQLDRMAQRFGVTPARARTCMADAAGLDRLLAMRQAGMNAGITGTPGFLVNGRLADHAHDWDSLAPLVMPGR